LICPPVMGRDSDPADGRPCPIIADVIRA